MIELYVEVDERSEFGKEVLNLLKTSNILHYPIPISGRLPKIYVNNDNGTKRNLKGFEFKSTKDQPRFKEYLKRLNKIIS